MKFTAFVLAMLLVFSLAACTPDNNKGTDNNDNNSNLNGDSSDVNGTDNNTNGNNNGTPNTNNNGNNTNGSTNGTNGNNTNGTPDFGEDYKGDRRFYYAGRLYQITDDKVDPDEVGAELFSITDMVEDDPAAEGEGLGLDLNTNIYKFKEENEYNELIVKIGATYYKAVVRDDDLIPDTNENGNNTNGSTNNTNGNNTGNGTAKGAQ